MNINGFTWKEDPHGLEMMIHEKCGNAVYFNSKAQMVDIQSACELHTVLCETGFQIQAEQQVKSEGAVLAEKLIEIGERRAVAGIAQLEPFISPKQRNLIFECMRVEIKSALTEASVLIMRDSFNSMFKMLERR